MTARTCPSTTTVGGKAGEWEPTLFGSRGAQRLFLWWRLVTYRPLREAAPGCPWAAAHAQKEGGDACGMGGVRGETMWRRGDDGAKQLPVAGLTRWRSQNGAAASSMEASAPLP